MNTIGNVTRDSFSFSSSLEPANVGVRLENSSFNTLGGELSVENYLYGVSLDEPSRHNTLLPAGSKLLAQHAQTVLLISSDSNSVGGYRPDQPPTCIKATAAKSIVGIEGVRYPTLHILGNSNHFGVKHVLLIVELDEVSIGISSEGRDNKFALNLTIKNSTWLGVDIPGSWFNRCACSKIRTDDTGL